jgi:Na+/melibiose symporter-like transporter
MDTNPTSKKQSLNLWRHPEFMKFWAGQTISVFGSSITELALPLTAVITLSATPAQMGLLRAAGSLPFLLVSLFAGAWVDRTRRRPILLWADFGRAGLLALIPLSMLLGYLNIGFIYFVQFVMGILTIFFGIAYQAYLPTLVGREQLVDGNSKMEISFSTAAIAGPGMAGWLIEKLSAPFAIAFDAVSFLISALSLSLIHTPEDLPAASTEKPDIWKEIGDGLKVVFGNRILWSIAGSTATSNLFGSLWGAMFVLYMTRVLELNPAQIGIIFVAGAPGALLGALASTRLAKFLGLGPTLIFSIFLSGPAGLLVLLARGRAEWIIAVLMVSGFLTGFSSVVYNINQVSLRQVITPNRLLGRMNASMRFLVWGTIPLGAFLASALSSTIGVTNTLLVGLIGGAFAFLWVLLSPVRSLKENPAPASD